MVTRLSLLKLELYDQSSNGQFLEQRSMPLPSDTNPSRTDPQRLVYRPVSPTERQQALSMLMTGQPRAHQEVTNPFLNPQGEYDFSLEQLWAAYRHQEMLALTEVAERRI